MKIVIFLLMFATTVHAAEKNKNQFPQPPKLKEGEYAIAQDEKYVVVRFKKFADLELSENCFKKSQPSCLAYSAKDKNMPSAPMPHPAMNNLAALYCKGQGGENLIGLDLKNREYNFCKFSDGTYVSSWDLYFKVNPIKTIK